MNNERVIKIALLTAIGAIMLAAAIAVAQQSGSGQQNTNSANSNSNRQGGNANGNTSSNANSNAGDAAHSGMGHENSNAGNQNTSGGALGSNDRKFVMEAATGGMAEVELGRMAAERGASDAVKQFGQRMVDDHTRANQELMQLASGLGVTPPATLDPKHQALVAKMSRLSGAGFDRAYAKQMVADHQKAVSLFQREADRGSNAGLKSFAGAQLPALQEHLRMARELAGTNTGRTTNSNMR